MLTLTCTIGLSDLLLVSKARRKKMKKIRANLGSFKIRILGPFHLGYPRLAG